MQSKKIIKSFPAFISKADVIGDLGLVGAYVAVMGNIDYGDDIIASGAFTKTISERASKIKVLDNHNSFSVLNAVGKLNAIQEVSKQALPPELLAQYPDATGGLYVEIQFILEVATDTSAQAFRLIKHGVITEYSIGFEIIKQDYEDVETDEGTKRVRIIREIKLWEVSPVIFAMNPATMTQGTKSDDTDDIEPVKESPIVEKESDKPIEQKRIPDGYRMAHNEEMCGNCFFFRQVTSKRGYCTYFEEVVLFNYVSDVYQQKARMLSDDISEALLELLEARIVAYEATGVYSEDDTRRMREMLDSLVSMLLEMIPSDLTNRPMPEMTVPKNKNLADDMQSKAESDNNLLTDDSRKVALSRIAEIRERMNNAHLKRRKSNGVSN
jgi:HK97 family phage prohead protease